MKKLLLVIVLIVVCTREYTCDGHVNCPADDGAGRDDEGHCYIDITVDWPDGETKAIVECEEDCSSVWAYKDSIFNKILAQQGKDPCEWNRYCTLKKLSST